MGRLRLVTFDLDNTLWPVEEVILGAEQRVQRHLAERYPTLAALVSARVLRDNRNRLLARHPTYAGNLTALRRDSMRDTLRQAGLSWQEATRGAAEAFEVFQAARNEVRLFEGAREVLTRLSRRYLLGALTNGNADIQRAGLGDVLSFQFSAESVGARKPDPTMFREALRHAGLRADEAVHVGDHPIEDVKAALDLGLGAVWANPLGAVWPVDHPHPEMSFSTFAELATLAERW